MPDYVRVAVMEGDAASIDALVAEISRSEGPPPGVPSNGIRVLVNRSAGQAVIAVRFPSEEALREGDATLSAMTPPEGTNIRRVSVEHYEVAFEMSA